MNHPISKAWWTRPRKMLRGLMYASIFLSAIVGNVNVADKTILLGELVAPFIFLFAIVAIVGVIRLIFTNARAFFFAGSDEL